MRKGFSVFTPMVGTLVILITMLIVSSIILSERVAVQGSVESYRSSELANTASSVQSAIIEEARDTINTNLESPIGGTPGVSIAVDDCPAAAVASKFYKDPPDSLVCSSDGGLCSRGDTCWGNAINEVNKTATNELVYKSLLKSSIENKIRRIVGKYALINVTSRDVPFKDIIKGISFVNCKADSSCSDDISSCLDDCDDGRLKIDVDFTVLKDKPIAEIQSKGKRLEVFMPMEKRTYTTHEPFMQYAILTASLFQNFQLLNNSWHNAGGSSRQVWGYDDSNYPTNGSEWYHYNYAEQERYHGNPGKVDIATGWAPGFKTDVLDSYFEEGGDLSSYIMDNLGSASSPDTRPNELRFNGSFSSSWQANLKPFVSGYATIGVSAGYPTLGIGEDPQPGTVFPAGVITTTPTTRTGTTGNCLAHDDTFGLPGYYSLASPSWDPNLAGLSGTTLVNTTGDYDRKFDKMPELVGQLAQHVRNNRAMLAGFGIADPGSLNYKLVVTSNQYYIEESGFKGKDNWHCGQFLMLYQTTTASDSCKEARDKWGGSPDAYCVAGSCDTGCTADSCPWFISEPVNWTCDAKTLYRVEEMYRLYRSNSTSDEPTRPVFAAKYVREKVDYSTLQGDKPDYSLWNKNPRYSDIITGDDISSSLRDDEAKASYVRHCTYEYSTKGGSGVSTHCERANGESAPLL